MQASHYTQMVWKNTKQGTIDATNHSESKETDIAFSSRQSAALWPVAPLAPSSVKLQYVHLLSFDRLFYLKVGRLLVLVFF